MPITRHIFEQFKTHTLVETGCREGLSIDKARDAGFVRVISCDLNPHWCRHCEKKFDGENVTIFEGDSATIFGDMLDTVADAPYTVFLDAHWYVVGEPIGKQKCPLMFELATLATYVKNGGNPPRAIIVDDIDIARKKRDKKGFPTSEEIVNWILDVDHRYRFSLHNGERRNGGDVMAASLPQ